MKSKIIFLIVILQIQNIYGQYTLKLAEDERVWVGVIEDGYLMPFFKDEYEMDLFGNNKWNQLQPLIITNKGQYVWSEDPFKFKIDKNEIVISNSHGKIAAGRSGTTLAEVQKYARENFFKFSGQSPNELLFRRPQYNTWIELSYNQNQHDIIEYAKSIIKNGLPPGVIMIDDTWQEDYGLWQFHPGRFPDPGKMMDELHKMGFKVMLWICPFVSADQTLLYNKLREAKAFLLEKKDNNNSWENLTEPAMIRWWYGVSALLDFSNPEAVSWFDNQLSSLVNKYDIDGFKFDAGDMVFYSSDVVNMQNITANEQCKLYAEFGLKYLFNEYRATWKMGGAPLAQRIGDKGHSWNELQKLIPQMILQNLMGYIFSCPDMIGGGLLSTFQNADNIDQDLVVRSAQCQALMTMMQFSVAPWRILDNKHFEAIKKVVEIRNKLIPEIMDIVNASKHTGEPVIKSMEYMYPGKGYEDINDQFILGEKILVAPHLIKDSNSRSVVLPDGVWIDDMGETFPGNQVINIEVPLDRLPYYKLKENKK